MPTTVLPTMTSTGRPLDTNVAKRIQPVPFADLPADAALASTTFNARHESIVAPTIDHARPRELASCGPPSANPGSWLSVCALLKSVHWTSKLRSLPRSTWSGGD